MRRLPDTLDPRARQFLQELCAGSARRAEDVVRAALRDGLGPDGVQERVIAPAMRAVGELWARDELSVADEHLATAITFRVLDVLGREPLGRAGAARQRIMLAALEGEHHVMGLRMVGDALERAGFEVQLVGADVPLEALLSAVARYSPAALGLSVTMPQPDTLRRAIERIQQVDPALAVLVGGAGVPPELRESPAPRYVATADASVDALEALLPAAA